MPAPDTMWVSELASGVLAGAQPIDGMDRDTWAAVATAAVDLVAANPASYRQGTLAALVAAMAATGHAVGAFAALRTAADTLEAVAHRIDEIDSDSPSLLKAIDTAERGQLALQARGLQALTAWPGIEDLVTRCGISAHRLLRGLRPAIDAVRVREDLVRAAAAELATASLAVAPPLATESAFENLVHLVAGAPVTVWNRDSMDRWADLLDDVAEQLALVAAAMHPAVPVPRAITHAREHAAALRVLHKSGVDVEAAGRGDDPGPHLWSPPPWAAVRREMLSAALPEAGATSEAWSSSRAAGTILAITRRTIRHEPAEVVEGLPTVLAEMAAMVGAATTLWDDAPAPEEPARLARAAAELAAITPGFLAMRGAAAKVLGARYDELATLPPHDLAALATALLLLAEPPGGDGNGPSLPTGVFLEMHLAAVANHAGRRGSAAEVRALEAALAATHNLEAVLRDVMRWDDRFWTNTAAVSTEISTHLNEAARLLDEPTVVEARAVIRKGLGLEVSTSIEAQAAAAILLVGEVDPDRCLDILGSEVRRALVGAPHPVRDLGPTLQRLAPIIDWFRPEAKPPYSRRIGRLQAALGRILRLCPEPAMQAAEALAALGRLSPAEVDAGLLARGLPLAMLHITAPRVGGVPLTLDGVVGIWREHILAALRARTGTTVLRDSVAVLLDPGEALLMAVEAIIGADHPGPRRGALDAQRWLERLRASLTTLDEGTLGTQSLEGLRFHLDHARVPPGPDQSDPAGWSQLGVGIVLAFALGVPTVIPPERHPRPVTGADIIDVAFWLGDAAITRARSDGASIDAATRAIESMGAAITTLEPLLDAGNARQTSGMTVALRAAAARPAMLDGGGRGNADRELVEMFWSGRLPRLSTLDAALWLPLVARVAGGVGRPTESDISDPRLHNRHPGFLLTLVEGLAADLFRESRPERLDRTPWPVATATGAPGHTRSMRGGPDPVDMTARGMAADAAEVAGIRLTQVGDDIDPVTAAERRSVADRLMQLAELLRADDAPAVDAAAMRAAAPHMLGEPLDPVTASDLPLILRGALLLQTDGSGEAYVAFVRGVTQRLSSRDVPIRRASEGCAALRFAAEALPPPAPLRDAPANSVAAEILVQLARLEGGLAWRLGHRSRRALGGDVEGVADGGIAARGSHTWLMLLETAAAKLDPYETGTPADDPQRLLGLVADLTEHVRATQDEWLRQDAHAALLGALRALAANYSVCDDERRRHDTLGRSIASVDAALARLGWKPPDPGTDGEGRDGPWGPDWGGPGPDDWPSDLRPRNGGGGTQAPAGAGSPDRSPAGTADTARGPVRAGPVSGRHGARSPLAPPPGFSPRTSGDPPSGTARKDLSPGQPTRASPGPGVASR